MSFTDPLPTVALVTADAVKRVTAIGNAGPTDAGAVTTWWEVEIVSGSTEIVYRIDETSGIQFDTNRNHTDNFIVPPGLSFDSKQIRFCIRASDNTVWYSTWATLSGDNYNNIPVVIPTPPPLTEVFVPTTLQAQAATLAAREAARRQVLSVAADSRHKLSRIVVDADSEEAGPVFAPMPTFDMFIALGLDYRTYRLKMDDPLELDALAVKFYGEGQENLWWILAYANAVIHPELDMVAGNSILIPPRTAILEFLAAAPELVA